MPQADGLQPLVALGFNALEALVYEFLLRESPATGYRVAQAIGKPAANTYKAIESLEQKGAVIVEEGESRRCRAVPAEELLGQLERRFQEHRARALRLLRRRSESSSDDRVYQLRSREQVMERCRRMLGNSVEVALVDVFPEPLEELRADIEAAAARGVDVAVKVYRPAKLAKADVAIAPRGESVIARWPGQWLNVVVDGKEHLLALLESGGGAVHHAVFSGSAYVSWVYHSALSSEIVLAAVEGALQDGASRDDVQRILTRWRRIVDVEAPGYVALVRRFGGASDPEARPTKPGRPMRPTKKKSTKGAR